MRVRVDIQGVHVDPAANQPVLLLRARQTSEGDSLAAPAGTPPYVLPIWVGPHEANAIALALEGIETPRPLTHDLMGSTIAALGASVSEVAIVSVEDSTYFARISLRRSDGESVSLDARPSDAVALALRLGAPVFVEQAVLEHATSHDVGSDDPTKLAEWFGDLDLREPGTPR